jgi:hypothetical protein
MAIAGIEEEKAMKYGRPVPYLLGVIFVLLAVLVPGGPVETRSFSILAPWVYWGFNTFLISLGIFTVITLVFAVLKRRWAFIAAIVAAGLYILVYVLDLAGIFPVSPDPMPAALLWIEVIDSILAAVLIVFSVKSLKQREPSLTIGPIPMSTKKVGTMPYILISMALQEDLGESGDVTSTALFGDEIRSLMLMSKDSGILAGIDIFWKVFARVDPDTKIKIHYRDGATLEPGDKEVLS